MANIPLQDIEFPGLPDKYVVPVVDNTLTKTGAAADAKKVGDEITSIKQDLSEKGLSEDAKVALLNCFSHVAWIDEHGQDYYDTLEDALYPDTGLVRITAVFTQGSTVIYQTTPLSDLKAYLVVTGHYNNGTSNVITDYALSGTLEVGTSTITVTKEGKTATFIVTVSAPYWDYEWDASSETLPEYMTASSYDFTTELGALCATAPVLDFNYVGNCKLEITMRKLSPNKDNNPQILIKNAVVSEGQFRGIKIIMGTALGTTDEYAMAAVSVNGVNALIPDLNCNEYHTYELTANNNVYEVSIDGEPIEITQNTNTSPYYGRTGITCGEGGYVAFIKSIKFKRL